MSKIADSLANICENIVKEVDKIVIEFMQKKGISYDDLKENVIIQEEPQKDLENDTKTCSYWYGKELILSIKQKFDIKDPACGRCDMFITRGNW